MANNAKKGDTTHRPLWALSWDDYEQTLSSVLAKISSLPDVQGIFTFGEVSDPGISDLDLLVVVSDEVAASTLQAVKAAARADRVTRYVFSFHPPEVIPRRSLPDITYFPSLHRLRQVWGEPIEIILPQEEGRRFPRLADYVDFTFAVGVLWRQLAARRPHLRSFLYLLKVYAHSLRMADLVMPSRWTAGWPIGYASSARKAWRVVTTLWPPCLPFGVNAFMHSEQRIAGWRPFCKATA